MVLGHISIGVRDLERASRFYDAVLSPLGWRRVWTEPDGLGYGPDGVHDKLAVFLRKDAFAPGPGFHLAFDAPDHAAVGAFHAAALANGGTDEGGPALRPDYGQSYYAAFVRDPEGWKLEAVHQ
jgi:catechol 2,3-dioxygenase-like lactoylglutathione lyase family enzyme